MHRASKLIPFLLAAALPASAFAAKIEHTKIVEPKLALAAPEELKAIGQPTRFVERDGTLYVAGVSGIAAVSGDGKVLWSTTLDPIGVREITVDASGIAYTGYEIAAAKTSVWSFLGEMPKKLEFTPSVVGVLGPDGKKIWQLNGPTSRVSAPCLTPTQVAVLTGQEFHIYERADGKLRVADIDLDPALLPNEYAGRMFRPQPMFMDNAYVGAYFYNYYRISTEGQELAKEDKAKTNIVAGPYLYKGNILVGSYSITPDGHVNKSLITVVQPTGEFKKVWREDIADDHSATGDIVIDGDTVYASSNFTVSALDGSGKRIWDAEGKDGALESGSMRGVRFARTFGYRYWGGHLLALSGDHLYLATRREISKKVWADVITVLNKKDGSYVETIDMKVDLVDMAVWGDRLALATAEGTKFLALN